MSLWGAIKRAPGAVVGRVGKTLLWAVPGPVKGWILGKVAGVAASKAGAVLRDQVKKEEAMSATNPAGTKPGYQTTEFWLTLLAQLVGFAYMSGAIGAGTPVDKILGLVVTMLTAAGYTVSRGMAKVGAPNSKPGWKTTEFWMTLLSTAITVASSSGVLVAGTVAQKAVGMITTLLGLLGYGVSRGIAKGDQAGITIETFGDAQKP